MSRHLAALLLVPLLLLAPAPAAGDDDWHFRRTTPRAQLLRERDGYELGVPGGRAWGIESSLRPLTDAASVALEVAVQDPAVREAFVRVAYYDRETGRPRQMTIADSEFVRAGTGRLLTVILEPPDGAVAYRVRVLARLSSGHWTSSGDAISVRSAGRPLSVGRRPYTRLRPDGP